jgi:hypothetical protein
MVLCELFDMMVAGDVKGGKNPRQPTEEQQEAFLYWTRRGEPITSEERDSILAGMPPGEPTSNAEWAAFWTDWRGAWREAASWARKGGWNDEADGIDAELRDLPTDPMDEGYHHAVRAAAERVTAVLNGIVPVPQPPAAVPDDSAWVRSCPTIWREHLKTNKGLDKFRTAHPDMFRNKGKRRLEIHLAKWTKYWDARDKAGFEALDGDLQSVADNPDVQHEALIGAVERMADLRAKKRAGKR